MRQAAFGILILLTAAVAAQQTDPWTPPDLMTPEAFAASLKDAKARPVILYVGFPVLYRSAHIPGALLAGPASKPEGLEAVKTALANVDRERPVVLYCGCCPWEKCPNVRPAFKLVRDLGFRHAQLITIATNLNTDWISKGYPVERPSGQSEKP